MTYYIALGTVSKPNPRKSAQPEPFCIFLYIFFATFFCLLFVVAVPTAWQFVVSLVGNCKHRHHVANFVCICAAYTFQVRYCCVKVSIWPPCNLLYFALRFHVFILFCKIIHAGMRWVPLSHRNCTNSRRTLFSAAHFYGLLLVFYDLFTINFSFFFFFLVTLLLL